MTAEEILKKYGVPQAPKTQPAAASETDPGAAILAKHGVPSVDYREISEEPTPKPSGKGDTFLSKIKSAPSRLVDAISNAPGTLLKNWNSTAQYKPETPKGVWDSLTQADDPESRAALQSAGYVSGLSGDAAMWGLNKLLGKEGQPDGEWNKALMGNATPIPEQLQKQGVGTLASLGIGLPLSIATDPMLGFHSGVGYLKNPNPGLLKALKSADLNGLLGNLKENLPAALLENTRQAAGPLTPIASGGMKAGKSLYDWALRDANSAARKARRGVVGNPVSDYLWNGGDPMVTGLKQNSDEMKAAYEAAKDAKFADIQAGRTGLPDHDFAPEVTAGKKAHAEAAVKNHIEELLDKARKNMGLDAHASGAEALPGKVGLDPLLELQNKLHAAAADPDNEYFKALRFDAQDAHVRALKSRLRRGFLGEQNARDAAIDELQELAPDFAHGFEENRQLFSTGENKIAKDNLNEMMEAAFAGPRDTETRAALGAKWGRDAKGSTPMNTNAWAPNNKINAKKVNQMGSQRSVSKGIEDDIAASKGPDALAQYKADKQDYGPLANGKKAFDDKVEQSAKRRWVTAMDVALSGLAGAYPLTWLPVLGLKKIGAALNDNPRFGTGAADVVNRVAKSGVWDQMMRRAMLDNSGKGDNQ